MSAYTRATRRTAGSPGLGYSTPTQHEPRVPLDRPGLSYVASPASSSSPTAAAGTQSKLNVVTKVIVESRPKQDAGGASVRMYLKIALPLEIVSNGMTIPLFPEENVKIMTSHVHPLTRDAAPYKFPTDQCSLLRKAARALSLPKQSAESYLSAFGSFSQSSRPSSSAIRTSRTTSAVQSLDDAWPIDPKYTGDITVSNYQVSFVLPKEFPYLHTTGGDTDMYSLSHTPYKRRRSSVGERNVLQFMAAIEMFIPYLLTPPKAPYLLSIPTPKCLSNSIRLNVNRPSNTSSSFASLSSLDDETSEWHFGFDPPVATTPRPTRANSMNSIGHTDEELSDSSIRASESLVVQGTFPSTERIRIRWAKPTKFIADVSGGDGRGRVGSGDVKGEMTCTVIGQARGGVIMSLQYRGTCKEVWFSGVATLLGMDIGLEAKNSEVYWADGFEQRWEVGGGHGYTGFSINPSNGCRPSIDLAPPIPIAEPELYRNSSGSSTTSLLRAPLPTQPVTEYSFEGSVPSSSTTTLSSISSLPQSSQSNLFADSKPVSALDNGAHAGVREPGLPITLHLDMNALVPPAPNLFTFTISGTVLVVPRRSAQSINGSRVPSPPSSSTESELDRDPDPVVILPKFTVLAADQESTTTFLRNEIDSGATNIEVYNSSGVIRRDAQARKTVLQKGGYTKSNEDGVRIVLRSITGSDWAPPTGPPSRPRTPNGTARRPGYNASSQAFVPSTPKRDGPRMIPSVTSTVTPLILGEDKNQGRPNAYAVRLALAVPSDTDSEWLEFGLAQLSQESDSSKSSPESGDIGRPPNVEVASASLDGVSVRFETTVAVKQEQIVGLELEAEHVNGKEWLSWVRVHVNGKSGSHLVVDYVVKHSGGDQSTRSKTYGTKRDVCMNIFLPTFTLPVGRLEVVVDDIAGFDVTSLRSNLTHRHRSTTGHRLLHLAMDELFFPQLLMTVTRRPAPSPFSTLTSVFSHYILPASSLLLALIVLLYQLQLDREVGQLKHHLRNYPHASPSWVDSADPITVTTTVYATTNANWHATDVANGIFYPYVSKLPDSSLTSMSGDALPSPSRHQFGASSPPPSSDRVEDKVTEIERLTLPPLDLSQFLPSFRFELIDMRIAIDKVLETLDTVWHVLRRLYHYPLDPP